MSQSSYRLAPTITNGFGVASLIVGITGFCTLGIGGLAAIVLGVLGIRRSKDTHTGKGMSIAGMIIGGLSIVFYILCWSTIAAALHIGRVVQNTLVVEPPRVAVEQFLRDVAGNNLSAAAAESGIASKGIDALHEQVKDLGMVQSVDAPNVTNAPDGDDFLQGAVTFDKGQRHYTAHVSGAGGTYRVTSLAISP